MFLYTLTTVNRYYNTLKLHKKEKLNTKLNFTRAQTALQNKKSNEKKRRNIQMEIIITQIGNKNTTREDITNWRRRKRQNKQEMELELEN